jgi:hypothetical protein
MMLLPILVAETAEGQYMYLDANGDGVSSSADQLNSSAPTVVDVYLNTSQNRDESLAVCNTGDDELSVFSYVFCLAASGGTVTYSNFVNQRSEMSVSFGEVNAGNGFYKNGLGGTTSNPASLYRLATVTITAVSGAPSIDIVDIIAGSTDFTSFGTRCLGMDGSNAYTLGVDWFDADGLGVLLGGAVFQGRTILSGQGQTEPVPLSPAGVDSGCPQGAVACDFSPKPSITSAGAFTGTFISRDTITYFVSGPIGVKKGCQVQVHATSNLASEIGTGGHCHDPNTRPLPLLQPSAGNTGSDGFQFKVVHTWPEVAGRYHIFFEDAPGDTCGDFQEIFTVCIRREPTFSAGLTPLSGPGPGYELTHGADNVTRHPDHHYGTPKFNNALLEIAKAFRDSIPAVPILGYNDLSLRWGGVFDVDASQPWLPGHKGHRNGDMCDMRTHVSGVALYTRNQLGALKKILRDRRIKPIIHQPGGGVPPHWHLQPITKGTFN